MKTITKTFNLNDIHNNDSNTNNTADNFINNSLCSEHTIFFDIETTGFSHKTSFCKEFHTYHNTVACPVQG